MRRPLTLTLAAVALVTAGTGAAVADPPKPLRVAVVVPDVPYAFASGGSLTGFDVQMVRAAARAAGLGPVRWRTVRIFDRFIPLVASGAVDFGASDLTITADRRKVIDFGIPYESTPQGILARRGSGISSLSDLAGRTIGVIAGTTAVATAEAVPGATVRPYENRAAILPDLEAGVIDATIGDATDLSWQARTHRTLQLAATIPTGQKGALAFPKTPAGRTTRRLMNEGIAVLARNGTLARLQARWGVYPVNATARGR